MYYTIQNNWGQPFLALSRLPCDLGLILFSHRSLRGLLQGWAVPSTHSGAGLCSVTWGKADILGLLLAVLWPWIWSSSPIIPWGLLFGGELSCIQTMELVYAVWPKHSRHFRPHFGCPVAWSLIIFAHSSMRARLWRWAVCLQTVEPEEYSHETKSIF